MPAKRSAKDQEQGLSREGPEGLGSEGALRRASPQGQPEQTPNRQILLVQTGRPGRTADPEVQAPRLSEDWPV